MPHTTRSATRFLWAGLAVCVLLACGSAVRAGFRAVRVLRDLHYTELGEHGLAEALELGPGEIFVLGDNSADSTDSREWGAVRLEQLIGFAEAVVWPPASLRRLRPVREPAQARD